MRNHIFLTVLVILMNFNNIYSQDKNNKKWQFNFIENAENFNGSSNEIEGLVMTFYFYNKDKRTGNGGGWLIYKNGTKAADLLATELYPKSALKGMAFVKDLFNVKHRNPKVDSTMLKDFDTYLYIIDVKFLELRLNTDGEGAGKTYSYYEKYPLDIVVYKRKAGEDCFLQCDTYHANNEDEYFNAIRLISDYRKKTAIESNIAK